VKTIAAIVLLFVVQGVARGMEADSLLSVLIVTADIESAFVAVDGRPAGRTPVVMDAMPPGRCIVEVTSPSPESWYLTGIRDTVTLAAGDTARVAARLQNHVQLLTDPAGIPVYAGDSLAGFTPLLLPGGESLVLQEMTLRPPGASPVRLLHARGAGVLQISLQLPLPAPESRVMSISDQERGIPLRLLVTGGTALLSGVAAAAWKVRADEVYGGYRLSRDPAAREQTRRLDTSAAVALAAMQVSLGLFVYFLLSE
jgi:hypothetical protein